MRQHIVGREQEIAKLESYMASDHSEFIAIYGRRRIGKTFLVKEFLEDNITFRITGKDGVTTKDQLTAFNYALFDQLQVTETAGDWTQAFRLLAVALDKHPHHRKVIFIDELPWMDTRGSGFISAFESFWNSWASYRDDVKLIVCGSATTWMLDNVINSRGGLHNRITHSIMLAPFTLHETEVYFQSRHFPYERMEIMEAYMAVGGVAYYLSLFEADKSVAQNVQQLCFSRGGELTGEFDRIFRSLFKRADNYVAIITALKNKGMGMTRLELLDATGMPNNGRFSSMLAELEQCEFIRSYVPFGKLKKEMMYQLTDPFTLFYFKFMQGKSSFLDGYWLKMQQTSEYESWCGYAFETLCLHHINQIVRALGIDGTINTPCSWSYRPSVYIADNDAADEDLRHGAQIDLIIDRSDRCVTICEMKYSHDEYEITKAYDAHLGRRLRTFKKVTGTRKTLVPTFITPCGLYNNMYARKMVRQVTADDLFAF